MLQTTEQKTANPQMRKQVGFLLPNKQLSMESFLHWIKLGTEIRGKMAFGRNAFWEKCVLPCSWRLQSQLWKELPGLMETHCLPVLIKHTNNPWCDLLFRFSVGWDEHLRHSLWNSAVPWHLCSDYFSSLRLRKKTQRHFPFLFLPTALSCKLPPNPQNRLPGGPCNGSIFWTDCVWKTQQNT